MKIIPFFDDAKMTIQKARNGASVSQSNILLSDDIDIFYYKSFSFALLSIQMIDFSLIIYLGMAAANAIFFYQN